MRVVANLQAVSLMVSLGIVTSSLFPDSRLDPDPNLDMEIPKLLSGVVGVMYPVVLAVITSFDLSRVKNLPFRQRARASLRERRNVASFYFVLAILSLVVSFLFPKIVHIWGVIYINTSVLSCFITAGAILYMSLTFASTQKLKEDIEDQLDKEAQDIID